MENQLTKARDAGVDSAGAWADLGYTQLMISLGAIAHRGREIVIAQTHGSVGELPAERGHHFLFLEDRISPPRRVDTPYSFTIPIQNIVLLPTSTSYLRTKSSLP